jgi:glycosyltransferase involved in cell wall biosynthesis
MGQIKEQVAATKFDVVIVSEVGDGTGMAYYASELHTRPKILDCLEVAGYLDKWSSRIPLPQRVRPCLTWLKSRAYLRHLLRSFDVCTVPSKLELRNISAFAPAHTRLEIVPHSLDLDYLCWSSRGRVEPSSLVFNGSLTYFPNKDAAQFFLRDILPRIVRFDPDVKLRVLGDPADLDTRPWQGNGQVEFLGQLGDVRSEVWRAYASVVPVRYGSGTRVKIIESMALGTPVVSTSKGAEGLDVSPEVNILIADDPAEFAAQTVRLLRDPALRKRLAENGRRLVAEKYDWRVIGEQFNQLVEAVALRGAGG